MSSINSQTSHSAGVEQTLPAKEKICSMLGLSFQATYTEIVHTYQEHIGNLKRIIPCDVVEAELLNEKISALVIAFGQYNDEFEKTGEPSVSSSIAVARVKKNNNTMYSFHIPCVFWCIAKIGDCFWNCCCAWCTTGCGQEATMDGVSQCCYDEGGACDCLRPVDTFLAIAGIIAALIWIIRLISPSMERASEQRSRVRSERERAKFIREYEANYLPALNVAYSEWEDLQRYKTDIRHFLHQVQNTRSTSNIDTEYTQMLSLVDSDYSKLDERWQRLQRCLEELKSDKNNSYYLHMRNNSTGSKSYLTMFNTGRAPWKKDK